MWICEVTHKERGECIIFDVISVKQGETEGHKSVINNVTITNCYTQLILLFTVVYTYLLTYFISLLILDIYK